MKKWICWIIAIVFGCSSYGSRCFDLGNDIDELYQRLEKASVLEDLWEYRSSNWMKGSRYDYGYWEFRYFFALAQFEWNLPESAVLAFLKQAAQNEKDRQLAIFLLRCYGRNDEETKTLLAEFVRERKEWSEYAMASYLSVNNFRVDDFVREVMSDSTYSHRVHFQGYKGLFVSFPILEPEQRKENLEFLDSMTCPCCKSGYENVKENWNIPKELQPGAIEKNCEIIFDTLREKRRLSGFPENEKQYLLSETELTKKILLEIYGVCVDSILDDFADKESFVRSDKIGLVYLMEYDYEQNGCRYWALKRQSFRRLSWDKEEDVKYVENELAKLEALRADPKFLAERKKERQKQRELRWQQQEKENQENIKRIIEERERLFKEEQERETLEPQNN